MKKTTTINLNLKKKSLIPKIVEKITKQFKSDIDENKKEKEKQSVDIFELIIL